MDMQGIGAVSAAAVALIGVSTSLLIGRWQLRGALRAAQSTHQAGLAQAEANYRAALDAVRVQADSVHDHWRRGVRREAWSSFLLASEEVADHAIKMLDGAVTGPDELGGARREVKRTLVILELEGPPAVTQAAVALLERCEELVSLATHDGFAAQVWRGFYSALDEERRAVARMEQLDTPVHDAWSALAQLQHTLSRVREAHALAVRAPTHARPGTMAALGSYVPDPDALMADSQIAYEALERAHDLAVSSLRERLEMLAQDAEVLLQDSMDTGRIAMLELMVGERTRLDEARREFLAATRHALDGDLVQHPNTAFSGTNSADGSSTERPYGSAP